LGLRQRDLAQLLGVHVTTVTNWEIGRTAPARRNLPDLMDLLDQRAVQRNRDSLRFAGSRKHRPVPLPE
jgi:DNA-binding transcriptional regulator YiaG